MELFKVFKLVPRPPGARVLGCRWLYKIKRDKLGRIERHKARLTCKGYNQKEGVDFGETWAPTCRMRVFRFMLAEASSDRNIGTAQWDCTSAFLHADMDMDVWMEQPEGFNDGSGRVIHLQKALYGLK